MARRRAAQRGRRRDESARLNDPCSAAFGGAAARQRVSRFLYLALDFNKRDATREQKIADVISTMVSPSWRGVRTSRQQELARLEPDEARQSSATLARETLAAKWDHLDVFVTNELARAARAQRLGHALKQRIQGESNERF